MTTNLKHCKTLWAATFRCSTRTAPPGGPGLQRRGQVHGLKPNRALYRGGKPYDVIVGTFLVVGVDEEDFTDLREEDATYFEKLFHSPEKFKCFAGRLVISKVVSGGA